MQLEFGGRRYAVAAGDFVIGSQPDSTLVLTAPGVLPRHAVVRSTGQGKAVLTPGGPGAEILVNGVRVSGDSIPLTSGDKIAIAGQEITVSDSGGLGMPPVAPPPAAAAPRLNETVAGFPAMRRPPPMPQEPPRVTAPPAEPAPRLNETVAGFPAMRRPPPMPQEPARGPASPAEPAARLNETVAGFPAMRRPPPMPKQDAPPLASLLVKSGQRKGERLTVLGPITTFGRAEFSDLRLPDASVSATHARLQLREGVWSLTDLGSAGQTKVDGEPIREETALSPGVTISIGEVQLLFEPRDVVVPPGAGARTAVPAAAPAPPVRAPAPVPPRRRQAVIAVLVALGILILVAYFLLG